MNPKQIEIDIIKYNFSYYVIIISILLIYLTIPLCLYIPFLQWHNPARITFVVFLVLFLLLRYSDLYFIKTGTITIYSNGEVLIDYINSSRILEKCAFIIKYGGYKGEPKEMDIFFTGSGFRDGTRNLIAFNKNQSSKNNKPIRLFIKSKQQATDLKLFISTMSGNRIDASIEKSVRMRLPV